MASGAGAVVLVEGESDQVALQRLAGRMDVSLDVARVVAMCGVTNLRRHLDHFAHGRVAVLHDAPESGFVERVLGRRPDAGRVRTYVCDADLEDELVRALGVPATLAVLDRAGDLRSFHRLQDQPAQRGRDETALLRRFISARSGHKRRYADLLVGALELDRTPAPLRLLLEDLGP